MTARCGTLLCMRKTTAVLVLAISSVLVASATATAASQGQTRCKDDGHKYIYGKTATAKGKTKATFVGTYERFHPCGEDDGYFTHKGNKTITLTLTSSTNIKVFKNQLNPSANETITAAQFPHAFNKRSDEPFYKFSGPANSVTKLSEHFVS